MSEHPLDWSVQALRAVAERARRNSKNQSLDVLTISSTEGWVDQRKKWARNMAGKSIENYTLLRRGEFSYNRGNSKTYPQGCVFRLDKWGQALVPSVYHSFRITDPNIHSQFLAHFFLAGGLNEQLRRVITSSARDNGLVNITADEFFSSEIPIPPLAEQKKIAEILSSVDEVIENTESEISKLEDLKKATLNELLTKGIGNTEFKDSEIGRIPKSWDVSELSEVAEKQYGIVDGPFGSNLKSIHYRPSGVPVIQSGFVTSLVFKADAYVYVDQAKFDEQKRSSVSGGDIVMAKIGANAGASAMLPIGHKTGLLAGNCLKIAVDRKKADPRYVQQYLSWLYQIGEISRVRTVTAQPAISLSSLRKLLIPRPPIDEQEKIVEVTESISCNGWKAREKYDSIICLRSALMQDLLTGKVRVKVN